MILITGGIFGLSLVNSIFVDAMVADNNDEIEKKTTTGALYSQMFVRHWDHWLDEEREKHLFRIPVAGGDVEALTYLLAVRTFF